MWKKSADLTDVINTKILDEMFAVSSKDKKVVKGNYCPMVINMNLHQ